MPAAPSIAQINARLARGEAVVMTAMEFKKEVRSGYRFKLGDVDVVTTATRAVMSGTSAFMGIPADTGQVRDVWMNGVPAMIAGQGDGQVDVAVHGTAESRDFSNGYGGGHLFRDLVSGELVEVEWQSDDGSSGGRTVTLKDLPFARIVGFRNAYRNYSAFTNARNRRSYREHPNTIFANRSVPFMKALTVSGSGELNPLENDPEGRVIHPGMRILMNKSEGLVIGSGTRASHHGANLSIAADMRGMDPEFMGGFKTRHGMEITNSVAIPIPVVDDEVIRNLSQALDENITLEIADLADRVPFTQAKYADVWEGAALWVDFNKERCIVCSFQCPAEYFCPMGAISWRLAQIDQSLCVACGACTANCPGGAFSGRDRVPRGRIGEVPVQGKNMPVTYRLSNRRRVIELADYLKQRLLKRDFFLADSGLPLRLTK